MDYPNSKKQASYFIKKLNIKNETGFSLSQAKCPENKKKEK